MTNSSGNVFKSSLSAPQEEKTCHLLGTIRCNLIYFVLWADFFFVGGFLIIFGWLGWVGLRFFCLLPGAAEPWILPFWFGLCAFWSGVPRSEGHCCPTVLLSLPALCWRQGRMHKPSLLTINHAIDFICLHGTLCSSVEYPGFLLASGKVWHWDFFFIVWDSQLPEQSWDFITQSLRKENHMYLAFCLLTERHAQARNIVNQS